MERFGTDSDRLVRRQWVIRGRVQGVGMRPFVYRLALRHRLTGYIRNTPQGVVIECQGNLAHLEVFGNSLTADLPPAAEISHLETTSCTIRNDESEFRIENSETGQSPSAAISPDLAICDDCRADILNPRNRRFHHALISCTNCGPRFSIIRSIPYDRPNTTMADFAMCDKCRMEYTSPADRRFHAQPVSCPHCGPQVQMVDHSGMALHGEPIALAAQWLKRGLIVAIKGVGGFHLAVRADDATSVRRLRGLKHRDAKPLAVMVADEAAAVNLVDVSPAALKSLRSSAAPIVLARRRKDAVKLSAEVAPGTARLGVMLPYTPVQLLLFESLENIPLVMTSGNVSDEPIAIDNADALQRLGPLCDGILWHDRPIERCVEDSVVLDVGGAQPVMPVRRSRGYAPASIPLHMQPDQVGIAVGGELKNTVCLINHGDAILSAHLGDLHGDLAFNNFRRAIDDLINLHQAHISFVACDTHPMYISSRYAEDLAGAYGAELIRVQHHHAHAASVLAEHHISDRVLALVCDGTGLGRDGSSWGGELLVVTPTTFWRAAALDTLPLPGGDMAAIDIRRAALAILWKMFGARAASHPLTRRLIPDPAECRMLCAMLHHGTQCVTSSSVGRLFDAMAALLGICLWNRYEAEAATAVETAAQSQWPPPETSPLWRSTLEPSTDAETNADDGRTAIERLDMTPFWRHVVDEVQRGKSDTQLAAEFHWQLAGGLIDITRRQAARLDIHTVVLSGGAFCNQILLSHMTSQFQQLGFEVLRNLSVPCNDGGLSLGQAWVAAHISMEGQAMNDFPRKECLTCA